MDHSGLTKSGLEGVRELRTRVQRAKIPSSKLDETINIATWNIREFGNSGRKRLKQSLHYIAEILNQFDLIAVTELRKDLSELHYVMGLLGPYWKVVYSDWVPDAGGNKERIAYLYDKRAATFTGLAAELDEPRDKNPETGARESLLSWWRKPYMASFSAGSFDFVMISVHVQWGKKKAHRIGELERLADWIEVYRNDGAATDKDIIVTGDFNIPRIGDDYYKAITKNGLAAPDALVRARFGSNLARNKRYDQIFHYSDDSTGFTGNAGVLDFFYKNDWEKLYPRVRERNFTYELSDHLPLWAQLNINRENEKLDQLLA